MSLAPGKNPVPLMPSLASRFRPLPLYMEFCLDCRWPPLLPNRPVGNCKLPRLTDCYDTNMSLNVLGSAGMFLYSMLSMILCCVIVRLVLLIISRAFFSFFWSIWRFFMNCSGTEGMFTHS